LSTTMNKICHPCLMKQAYSVSAFAKLSEEQTGRIALVAKEGLERSLTTPLLPQHIARLVEDAVNLELGMPPDHDLYAELKQLSNEISLSYSGKFRQKIRESEKPLETGMHIAAAGNIIDFGAKNHDSINLDEELNSFDSVVFEHYDIERFKDQLKSALTLLYICDNCGEIVFDKLFIEEILREYPDLQITAAVRDRPIINDATLIDAAFIGLDSVVKVISSGSQYPGTILPEANELFRQLYFSSDIIISKGQGNFETLMPEADARLFFLLRIKCSYMAGLSGVPEDSLVLMQGKN
jgi:damage-control phosphatase, subfamily I